MASVNTDNFDEKSREIHRRVASFLCGHRHLAALALSLPIFRIGIVRRMLIGKGCYSLLDVGCGTGEPMQMVNHDKRFHVVGVDCFLPYLRRLSQNNIYDALVLCDVRYLPFKAKTFDAVVCLEVIEHLSKDEGLRLIRELELIGRTQVIISTPVGNLERDCLDGNPLQPHKSAWEPHGFAILGYRVRGMYGPRWLRKITFSGGNLIALPRALLGLALSVTAQPCIYFVPRLASFMVCTKSLDEMGHTDSG